MKYKVYILKNINSNLVKYVGITSGTLKSRLSKHYNSIKLENNKNKHKINWFNNNKGLIIIEKIEEFDDAQVAFEREKYWINYYRNKGINLINKTDGGEGCLGYKHDEETLKKMSGCNNHRFGKPNLINKDKLGRMVEYSIDGKKWILYKSMRDASKETGVTFRFIKKMCEGNYVDERSYYFRYHNDIVKGKKIRNKIDNSHRMKKVEAYLDGKYIIFDCAASAAQHFNLKREKIVMVCNGKRNHTGGIIFRYKKGTNE